MAKFKRERRTVTLHFPEGHDLEGLEVKLKTVGMGTFLDLLDLLSQADSVEQVQDIKTAAPALKQLYDGLANSLVSWNLVNEDDEDVPATLDGLRSDVLDTSDVLLLIGEWLAAIGGVYGPLESSSNSGKLFQGELPPMEPLSQSQES